MKQLSLVFLIMSMASLATAERNFLMESNVAQHIAWQSSFANIVRVITMQTSSKGLTEQDVFSHPRFEEIEKGFKNALSPVWYLQVPLTAIGLFLWDLQHSNFFGSHTTKVALAFQKGLLQRHSITQPVNFVGISDHHDYVKQHRLLYEAEYIDSLRDEMQRLVALIQNASLEKLQDAQYLEHELLLQLGLNNEVLKEFPSHLSPYFGKGLKSWQYPVQLSKFLVELSKMKVENYLEIGCHHGGTFIIVTEYLKRFNSSIKAVAVDPYYSLIMDVYVHDINPEAEYILDLSGSKRFIDLTVPHWDLSFIDGDHSYEGVLTDYNLVKGNSDVLVFHDIDSGSCPGVVKFWNTFKTFGNYKRLVEITDQYEEVVQRNGCHFLGIGIVFQK